MDNTQKSNLHKHSNKIPYNLDKILTHQTNDSSTCSLNIKRFNKANHNNNLNNKTKMSLNFSAAILIPNITTTTKIYQLCKTITQMEIWINLIHTYNKIMGTIISVQTSIQTNQMKELSICKSKKNMLIGFKNRTSQTQ